jgi:predicted MFS family arabinose efflux permease
MSAAQGVGFMFGPIVGGHLYEGIGPAVPFLLCSALLAGCLLLVSMSRAKLDLRVVQAAD